MQTHALTCSARLSQGDVAGGKNKGGGKKGAHKGPRRHKIKARCVFRCLTALVASVALARTLRVILVWPVCRWPGLVLFTTHSRTVFVRLIRSRTVRKCLQLAGIPRPGLVPAMFGGHWTRDGQRCQTTQTAGPEATLPDELCVRSTSGIILAETLLRDGNADGNPKPLNP